MFSRGDKALVVATGVFGHGWAEVARKMGVEVEVLDFGKRRRSIAQRIAEALAADKAHADQGRADDAGRYGVDGAERHCGGAGGDRRGGASGAARRRLHRVDRLRYVPDGRLGHRCAGGGEPEGADAAAGAGLRVVLRQGAAGRQGSDFRTPYWDWQLRAFAEEFFIISVARRRPCTCSGCASR